MKRLKYFVEFFLIKILFFFFRLLGYRKSSNIGEKIGKFFGPFFRNEKIILNNLKYSSIGEDEIDRKKIVNSMWGNYGRILSEYPFLKDFRNEKLDEYIKVNGLNYLEDLVKSKKSAIFVSGHFNNFELMAMIIEKNGVNLAALYRPLNNYFLNETMESIRKNYLCKKQIKKGKSGTRDIINLLKQNYSIALMIDQRVSEGIKINFFGRDAFTTTIPAQLIKKYNLDVIPVYIERKNNLFFDVQFEKPISFSNSIGTVQITEKLNNILERMILKNPDQWIWSHNRWR
tara:strand:+ start:4801 stop:5661 length:861 start_codon:yes stop_codon:yes gene_type:complete